MKPTDAANPREPEVRRPVYHPKTRRLIGWMTNRPLTVKAQQALSARFKGADRG